MFQFHIQTRKEKEGCPAVTHWQSREVQDSHSSYNETGPALTGY